MTQKAINSFRNEVFSEGPIKKYITNKTNVYHLDDTWGSDIPGLKDYGPEKGRR